MNISDQGSSPEAKVQDQLNLTALQTSSIFHSIFEPESLENFDFEKVPKKDQHSVTLILGNDEGLVRQSSGFTSRSFNTSFASTTPILQSQKPQQALQTATEEYILLNDGKAVDTENKNTSPLHDGVEIIQQGDVKGRKLLTKADKCILRDPPQFNYQIFPGNTRFPLKGRLVTSKDYRAFIVALFMLIAPIVLYFIFICPFFWHQSLEVIPILIGYAFVLAFSSMLKTSLTDPGILPRNLDIYAEEIMSEDASIILEPPAKEIQVKNTSYFLKYCETCKIYRPPRASHCKQCNNCVEVEDHHCIWLNNCVGRRNYRPFFTFISSTALLCVLVLVSATYQLILIIGGLTVYHCTLILRGVSTHEQIRADVTKAKYPELRVNPYSSNKFSRNIFQVLCQPQPKSYLRRRKLADPVVEVSS
ncbi:DHHC palmitoyltransferase-domain-containing protein [Mycotypha africana]|uniref:DHHC palmitoyltransferase-domain-containing protein n=1 Tax=Mycotypha africana TaxID=64632 RepID=UPI0023014B89|nr:DHHC palmitoyltransferase-domain-containing protein [Mycotypha africana]KAI8991419.1 DHHC palmitoyltransferase-domain-containing protein [Mycotypha africana]